MHGDTVTTRRFARLSGLLRASFGLLVDVALPQLCPSGRQPVEGAGLCPVCWSKLSFIAPPYCERLGIPFPFDAGPGLLSMEAIADPPAYNRARAAVRYDEIARKLRPCPEIRRPARPRADHGAMDGTGRPRAAR